MVSTAHTVEVIGGASTLGGEIRDGIELVRAVRRGMPVRALQHVLDSGRLSLAEIDRVVLPRRTLANRRRVGTLTAEQSDRLVRVARVLALAEETFGTQAKAAAWLRRPTAALAGERPLDLLPDDYVLVTIDLTGLAIEVVAGLPADPQAIGAGDVEHA